MLTAARRRPFRTAFVAVVAALGAFAATYSATGRSLQHLIGYPCR
ncbi:hypothetical protein [Aeromicrobium sp. 9AM]|nr:hypothetical protein [Aeromicrobium sp. 9AM]VXB21480.1 exported hypothetical protein [Aeromicrobium sp. 9AM]